MKPLALASLLVALCACDTADTQPGTLPSLSPDDSTAVRASATELALREQLASADSAEVAVAPERVEAFYEALVRVRASAEGDRVAGIGTFPRYVLRDLLVAPTPGAAWAEAWSRVETQTGYAPVDALTERYGLTLNSYQYGTALLRAEAPLNPVALASQFAGIPDLRYATPNGVGGDGDDIRASRDGRALVLAFSRGSGDCPAGCIERTTWTFRVEGDRVEYVGER